MRSCRTQHSAARAVARSRHRAHRLRLRLEYMQRHSRLPAAPLALGADWQLRARHAKASAALPFRPPSVLSRNGYRLARRQWTSELPPQEPNLAPVQDVLSEV